MARSALLFDLDGTLVDSAAGIATALSAVRRDRGGPPIAPADVRPLVSQGADILVARALGDYARDPAGDLAEFRRILRDLPPDPATIFPGAAEALATLSSAGHAMAIVTNKPEGLSRVLLDGLDLSRHFAAIVGGDTAAMPKPDRAPMDHALRALGTTADAAIMIGDSEVDAQAAHACAIPFILFEGGYGAAACEPGQIAARFAAFADLPGKIGAIG